MVSEAETAAMHRAVVLAASTAESATPNPNVGAVVLDPAGRVAGEGRHERAGGAHAEVAALRQAGEKARGGTVVVTLEPCAHVGRTGPCTEALLAAGVARVIYACADPTPLAGGGGEVLRAAGVEVEAGLLVEEAERANERWLTRVRHGRPYVVWKVAATLDGRVAAADGTSRWVSSRESRRDAHLLRAACDTVVAGVGTVLADDPHLTARRPDGSLMDEQPLRVVVDSHGRTPETARVRDDAAPTWLATCSDVGADPSTGVDLAQMMKRLDAMGRSFVLLEGGPTLAGSFLRAGLIDRLVAYVAPSLLGAGPPMLRGTCLESLSERVELEIDDLRRSGVDVRLSARLRRREV